MAILAEAATFTLSIILTLFSHAKFITIFSIAVADINKDGKIDPIEMLITRFVATDMLNHVYSSDELPTMTRLASEVLDLPPSHPDVVKIVAELKEKIDTRKNGRMTREEAIEALGVLRSRDILV